MSKRIARAREAARRSWLPALAVIVGFGTGPGPALAVVPAPVLKWQQGGCGAFCLVAWYSSPAAVDLDGDGAREVVVSGYELDILDGATGAELFGSDPPGGRSWADVAVGDIDGATGDEIVSVHGSGWLNVHDFAGNLLWSRQPTTDELRGVALDDLDLDGSLEIVVTAATPSSTQTWVYEHDGDVRSGWPQLSGGVGYAFGAYSSGVAVGDLDGLPGSEIVVPSDVHYLAAYDRDGGELAAHASFPSSVWGGVGTWEDEFYDLQGWGPCSPGSGRDSYRTLFTVGGALVVDVDGDGNVEVPTTGSMIDCSTAPYTQLYQSLYLFEPDRRRYAAGSYDWTTIPLDTGAPLSLDYLVIETSLPTPIAADLDGDGESELLYSTYDGRVHAFRLDKSEHTGWPVSAHDALDGYYQFASQPVVVDLDADGSPEVIFTSWTEKGSGVDGSLFVVSATGVVLHEIALPPDPNASSENGGMASPTLAELDGDPDLELLVNTTQAGVVAYDLPGSANARVLWRTGRGGTLRRGQGARPVCGDGVLETSEVCDDGNTQSNDGCSSLCEVDTPLPPPTPPPAPVLKWQYGGCNTTWCESAWYSSVVARDLDGDGSTEVVLAGYTFDILAGANGSSLHGSDPAGSRSWASVAVADLDEDDDPEIVSVHGGGWLNVHDPDGNLLWSRQPTTQELRGLALDDMDGDGDREIVVTGAVYDDVNTWVYDHLGNVVSGWPQNVGGVGQSHGAFSSGVAVGDIGGSSASEVIVPSDVIALPGYDAGGGELPANAVFTGSVWGAVPVWENEAFDIQGWGFCDPGVGRDRYRSNFALGGAVLADLDDDGTTEVVVTGTMYDCSTTPYQSRYQSLHVFSGDRERWTGWHEPPVDMGAPLSEDYIVIDNAVPNPVVADLDGDGEPEILYAAFDGKLHAFWQDKTERHGWPYSVYDRSEGFYRFASEPVVVDLEDDGRAEVIFTTWAENGSGADGRLTILSWDGQLLRDQALPVSLSGSVATKGMAAPTLAEIDGDADLELLVNVSGAGVVAYDLPGSAQARVLWKTSRGNDLRNGQGPLPVCGDGVRETIEMCDDGNLDPGDGCSPVCTFETFAVPGLPRPALWTLAALLLACGVGLMRVRLDAASPE